MKPLALLGLLSLAANVALVGALAWRNSGQTSARMEKPAAAAAATSANKTKAKATKAGATSVASSSSWAAIESGDLPTLIARLKDAGFPPSAIKAIVMARVDQRFAGRIKDLIAAQGERPYWQSERPGAFTPQIYEEMNQVYRDRAAMLREALTDGIFTGTETSAMELEKQRQFGPLSRAKVDAVERIVDDYTSIQSKLRSSFGEIVLPEDKEQLALLEKERRADLAAVLTPQELAEYEMRSSMSTRMMRPALTLMDATEEEFRAIYAAQAPYQDQSSLLNGLYDVAKADQARARVAEQLKAALGETRYADYVRSSSREFQQLDQLARRENVAPETAVQAYTLRDGALQESNRIYDDKTLSADERRAALLALAQSTREQIVHTLGEKAGNAYLQTTRWFQPLSDGAAVSFGPDGTSMRTRRLSPSKK